MVFGETWREWLEGGIEGEWRIGKWEKRSRRPKTGKMPEGESGEDGGVRVASPLGGERNRPEGSYRVIFGHDE